MSVFKQVFVSEQRLPKELSVGFLHIKSVRTLPINQVVYHQKSKNHIGLSIMGEVANPHRDHSLVYIQMYRLPKAAKDLAHDRAFFGDERKKWVRLPDGVNFEPTMLVPRHMPSTWSHEAFAISGHHIIRVFQNPRLALLLRFLLTSGTLLDHRLFVDVSSRMRIIEDQWNLHPPEFEPKRGKPPATDAALPKAVLREVSGAVVRGRDYIGISQKKTRPDVIQQKLYDAVNAVIGKKVLVKDRAGLAIDLGCLWGQTICDAVGWEWRSVRFPKSNPVYCVVSPDRAFVVSPTYFMLRTLRKKGANAENTTLLLYNMIKDGGFDDAPPKSYRCLN